MECDLTTIEMSRHTRTVIGLIDHLSSHAPSQSGTIYRGRSRAGAHQLFFWEKENNHRRKKAGRESKKKNWASLLAQGLDLSHNTQIASLITSLLAITPWECLENLNNEYS